MALSVADNQPWSRLEGREPGMRTQLHSYPSTHVCLGVSYSPPTSDISKRAVLAVTALATRFSSLGNLENRCPPWRQIKIQSMRLQIIAIPLIRKAAEQIVQSPCP